MDLITDGSQLSEKLIALIKKHENIVIAVAWASANTKVFRILNKHKEKIKFAVIGTHFYQTHPDVLENFIDCNEVRFLLQPQGIFHPKAYLFWSKGKWDVLIGSANLTFAALNKNSELMIHISSKDTDSSVKLQLETQIKEYWGKAEIVTKDLAVKYRGLWQVQQPNLKRVSGDYPTSSKKSPVHSKIMSKSWLEFFYEVEADPYHGFTMRCDLLEIVRNQFRETETYSDMDLGVRKTIAGLPNDFHEHWGWFGSMKGLGTFHSLIIANNLHFSDALGCIPMNGIVSRQHYNAYINEFIQALPTNQYVGIASRLLALKRPDYFVCLDSANKKKLCTDFGIAQTGMTYERYWDDVICRITDSIWWNAPIPRNREQARVWSGRAAMLDAIFYEEAT